ncbi:MAG: hypothetical protein FJ348_02635 [Sphingomonadales bacterium]|nr:hypothetical protein [Sphingomonadales bacterium]
MKSYFLTLAVLLMAATSLVAQNYDPVKTLVMLNQFDKAKTDIDKAFNNAKYTAKPEAFILKSIIYSSLANTDSKKGTPEAEQLIADADAAFAKFREMDPAMALLSEPMYQNGAVNLYSTFYTSGYNDYSKKNWGDALVKLKKAIGYSDILTKFKLLSSSLDTNVLILAGITAESGGFKDDALVYYQKLANAKVGGDGFEGVYRYLITYSFGKKDMEAFERYKALGKEVFPKSDYFDYDKVDFAVGLANGFEEKLKAIDELLATDPDNFKANQVLGEILYDTLDPRDTEAVLPAYNAELEKKMIGAFNRAAKARPGYEIPYLYIGDHFINKASVVSEKRDQHAKDMKARTKPGTMASKEDIAKRDALDKEYGETLEGAKEPYEAAAGIFAARGELDTRDKQQYKKATSYLADIFAFKKAMAAKAKNTADQAKWAAEEKKWNDRYESIKN